MLRKVNFSHSEIIQIGLTLLLPVCLFFFRFSRIPSLDSTTNILFKCPFAISDLDHGFIVSLSEWLFF